MANLQFNTNKVKRVPINRNNLFYDENSFQYEMTIAKNYIEQDLNQTLVLFEVDLNKTNLNNEYKEAKSNGVVFKTPVEIHCMYNIQQGEMATYDKTKNLGVHIKPGKLNFNVMEATLKELGCDIKIGDYVGVQVTPTHMEYYVVTNDGRNNFDNAHSVYGTKPAWRSVECAPVSDKGEFDG
jgi:hypothetical protein